MRDYYLDQMGIERWVFRETKPSSSQISKRIWVFVRPLQGKAQHLFHHMLQSIEVAPEEIEFIPEEAWQKKDSEVSPRAILVLEKTIAGDGFDVPIFYVEHPHMLLQSLANKKQAYTQLLEFRRYLNDSQP